MTDHDVDALYQQPLAAFTTARNALAKSRGTAGAGIKALEKPTLPAWAVNAVYWHARTTWDALIRAAVTMRQAHVDVISGRRADVPKAEATHAAARRDALRAATRLIEQAGEKATAATVDAITETLDALPSNEHPPGRLTKPLKPLGFGALMNMGVTRSPEVPKSRSPGVPKSRAPEVRAAREARKAAEKNLRTAEAAEAAAERALADAKKAATHAERELARVRDRIVFLEKQRDDAEAAMRSKARALQEAANTRVQAAQDLDRLPD